MKLVSAKLEQKAIRALCESKVNNYLLASLNEDHFYYSPCKKAFKRLNRVLRDKNYIMDWDELLEDPVLESTDREILSEVKKTKIKSEDDCKRLISKLDTYRKLRALVFMADKVIKTSKGDKINIDDLIEEATDELLKARNTAQIEECFTHIGSVNNADDKVKNLLKGKSFTCIPTGFKQWDSKNRGFISKGLITIASTSGGGKSALSEQLFLNMTKRGTKCCYVPLEMSDDELLQRMLANIANVEMSEFLRADEFSSKKQVKIYKKYLKYQNKLKDKNTTGSIFVPPEDMTMEEILFLLKPMKYRVIFIDYIGLLKGVGGDDSWQKLGAAARFAKVFANNNDCMVILCAQLSESGAIKYSKAIQEHSNTMWTWIYDETAQQTGIVEVNTLKGRNQTPITFYLKLDFSKMRITDITPEERELFMEQTKKDEKAKPNQTEIDEDLYNL